MTLQHIFRAIRFLGNSYMQGSHASWKVLDFFLKIPGPGKALWSWKVLEEYP